MCGLWGKACMKFEATFQAALPESFFCGWRRDDFTARIYQEDPKDTAGSTDPGVEKKTRL